MAILFSKKTNWLITITLLAVVVLTLPSNTVLAQTTQQQELKDLVTQISNCDNFFGVCLGSMMAWSTYYILQFVTYLFSISGYLFDAVSSLALNPSVYDIDAIRIGWTTARDTANLFFIFILLTIAIATILRLETYGAKALLPKLLIAALFINFSFLLTQYVIFSSNIFTVFFVPGAEDGVITKSLTIKFLAGFQPNQMFASTNLSLGTEADKIKELNAELLALKIEEELSGTTEEILAEIEETETELQAQIALVSLADELTRLIISMLGVIIFISVAMFVLFMISIMLIVRIVILWFLMILSPIAFLFWVLPGLRGQASRWWRMLLSQAFWPVVFFFLFSITVNMIASGDEIGSIKNIIGSENKIDQAFIANITMILYYILLIVMLLFSLVAAKQMGAQGANLATRGVRTLRRYAFGAGGFAGRIALPYARRAGAEIGGGVARGVQGEGRIGKALRSPIAKFTGVGRLANLSANAVMLQKRKTVEEKEKGVEKLNTKELKNRYALTFDPAMKAAIINQLAKKKDLKLDEARGFTKDSIEKGKKYLKAQGMPTKEIDALRLQYATKGELENPVSAKELIRTVSPKYAADTMLEGGEASEDLATVFKTLGATIEEVTENLRSQGNNPLAGWVEGSAGRPILKSILGSPAEEEPPEEEKESPEILAPKGEEPPEILAPSGRPAREELESPGRQEPREPRERMRLEPPYIEREDLTAGEYKEQQREEQRKLREEEREFKRTKDFREPPKE